MELIGGQITAHIVEIGSTIKYQAMVNIVGTMVVFTTDIGRTTTCMVRASTNGLMVVSMLENTSKTRRKAMECILTQMVDNTKAVGRTESNTERGYLLIHREIKEEASGWMEREKCGHNNRTTRMLTCSKSEMV